MKAATSILAAVLALITIAHGTPVLSRAKRVDPRAEKVNDLREKLVDINSSKEKGDADKTSAPVAIGSDIERNSREPMRSQYDDEVQSRQAKVKLLATRLVDGDRKTLKMVEHVLAQDRSKQAERGQDDSRSDEDEDIAGDELGFHDETVADMSDTQHDDRDTGTDPDVEKDIMTLLQRYKQHVSQQHLLPRSRSQQVIQEGHFGDFQHQVLHAVEDRLLKDIQMALHSGFTVKDIIQDLEAPDGTWGDTKKREIERELDTLKSLRRTD
ncbi:uncharacterized protein [Haliotis asinina]|uniref:uncharacterized protein n=1 Tax=Haliotis asinina TaxID=109174 RepID=UPI0035325AD0